MAKTPSGKIHPKLRMVGNANFEVNQIRAELSSTLCLPASVPTSSQCRGEGAVPIAPNSSAPIVAVTRNWEPDKRTLVNVFVDLRNPSVPAIPGEKHRKGSIALAEIAVADVQKIAARKGVAMVSPSESLKFSEPVQSGDVAENNAQKAPALPKGARQGPVLVGIVDVQGFDFAHEDFLAPLQAGGKATRFVRIWDQGGRSRKPPQYLGKGGKPRFDYGSEIRADHMNKALADSAATKLPAVDLEPQSQTIPGSHGTHVASIAAGNSGVCPYAFIAGVLIALPASDLDRRKSFYDSSRLVDAIEYLIDVAEELGKTENNGSPLPISINVSLGTNGDAHDGSSPLCRWIENSLSISGRCVTVAGGNAGQSAPLTAGDLGFVMGRIHTAGKIASRGLETRLEWTVIGNGRSDISENELEIWYSGQDRFRVWLQPPDSSEWIGPVDERQYIENRQLPDSTFVSIYNEIYHPVNGCNQIAIYLSPYLKRGQVIGVASGIWTVRLEGTDIRDGRFHGWIERDDPAPVGKIGTREAWRFPSFFSERTNVPVSQISSLACSPRVISVANLDLRKSRIHATSSQGPTRDGRLKPDIAAAGTDIVAAKGFSGASNEWIALTGTSMASPYVAGIAATMLSLSPQLNAAQIGSIIQRTARPLPGKTFDWANDAGFGVIDPQACLDETLKASRRQDITDIPTS
ncbi:S8 family serine peptidase [Bradyrhizobium jicamae]|uniref:S8 family serine peptidase n=1 Tax=Bradyrhizobium jicamae TaxID=280332 RepID=UPI001BA80C4F|nr:S8 family serine peptidase [Bradyrhizobium jicamae]MBR0757103.1 S8 family serine peptidase [Bradyrhizobium jicamae]